MGCFGGKVEEEAASYGISIVHGVGMWIMSCCGRNFTGGGGGGHPESKRVSVKCALRNSMC